MNKNTSRRSFLTNSAKATLAITAGIAASSSLMKAYGAPGRFVNPGFYTGFAQEPLAYSYGALDKRLMQ
ncbi:MAG: hypothetical protein WDO16_14560 [Bacteroidota bacterium]